MSFGKSSSSSSQEMDPQIKQSLLDVFQRGRQLSYTPYNPYQFATVAAMSPSRPTRPSPSTTSTPKKSSGLWSTRPC